MSQLEELREIVERWRSAGEAIGFVNGCFDVLHKGHLVLLDTAWKYSRRLIVAVNSDEYCRKHKGPSRPIQPAEVRARIARSVSDADVGISFEGDSPVSLLDLIRPDVYVIGDEYNPAPGAEFCGITIYVPRVPGFSTTRSITT